MPVGLVTTTSILDVVSHIGTLDEWMLVFRFGVTWIVFLKWLEEIKNLSVYIRGSFLEDVFGNFSTEEMSLSPPGLGGTDD